MNEITINGLSATLCTNSDVCPPERFVSVRHIESGCGCDFYESGDEIDWEDAVGLLANCDQEVIEDARERAAEELA